MTMLRLVHSGLNPFDRATVRFQQARDERDIERAGVALKEMNALARRRKQRRLLVPVYRPRGALP